MGTRDTYAPALECELSHQSTRYSGTFAGTSQYGALDMTDPENVKHHLGELRKSAEAIGFASIFHAALATINCPGKETRDKSRKFIRSGRLLNMIQLCIKHHDPVHLWIHRIVQVLQHI
jgi:hypothetical protein